MTANQHHINIRDTAHEIADENPADWDSKEGYLKTVEYYILKIQGEINLIRKNSEQIRLGAKYKIKFSTLDEEIYVAATTGNEDEFNLVVIENGRCLSKPYKGEEFNIENIFRKCSGITSMIQI